MLETVRKHITDFTPNCLLSYHELKLVSCSLAHATQLLYSGHQKDNEERTFPFTGRLPVGALQSTPTPGRGAGAPTMMLWAQKKQQGHNNNKTHWKQPQALIIISLFLFNVYVQLELELF